MCRRARRFGVSALAMCLWLTASSARAEPIVITVTSGTAEFMLGTGGPISIAGDHGFSLTAHLGSLGAFSPTFCCYVPGTTLSFGGTWVGLDVRDATVTFLGSTYEGVGRLTSESSIALNFSSDPVLLPPIDSADIALHAPFAFTGLFVTGGIEPIFAELTGSGMGTAFLRAAPGGIWQGRGATFEFADPIPEPSTMVLAGTALLAALHARRRRRGRTTEERRAGP